MIKLVTMPKPNKKEKHLRKKNDRRRMQFRNSCIDGC